MVRLSRKNLALMSVAALALLAGGSWGYLHDASAAAAPTRPKIGEKAVCQGVRDPLVSVNQGPLVGASTEGAIGVSVGNTYVNSDGLEVTELKVDHTLTKGSIVGFGDLTITLDDTREVPVSTLTSNQRDQSFPATQVMRFNPMLILNGEIFRTDPGAPPAALVNSDVKSFPPPAGTVYALTNPLNLKSDKGNTITVPPGRAFTIKSAS
jgi:hypothetical protein